MTPLTQQLEDKKKGCGKNLGAYMEVPKEYENAPDKIKKEKSFSVEVICGKQEYCKTCQAEIAILEQAIAEKNEMRDTAKIRILRFCEIAQRKDTNYYLNKAEALQEFFVITDEELTEIKNIQNQQKTFKTSQNDRQGTVQTLVSGDEEVGVNSQFLRDNADNPQSKVGANDKVNCTISPVVSNLLQKQRQEEIEFLQWIYTNNGVDEDFDNVMISIDNRINRLEQQLNQPKTEE